MDAYVLTAVLYFDEEDYQTARHHLLLGNKVSNASSSEVLYFLGYANMKLGEVAEAKKYAQAAAKLGYPLSGLMKKIEELEKIRSSE